MSDWYYSHDGQQRGPVPVSELQRLADNGEFDPEKDLVWREGLDDWKPAANLPELGFAAPAAELNVAGAPAPEPDNPYAAPASGLFEHSPVVGSGLPAVKPTNYALMASLTAVGAVGTLIGYGIIFASIFRASNGSGPAPEPSGASLALISTSFVVLMAGGIIGLVYLYRAWMLLQPHTQYTTPGKAVGFLFIPLFNLYWPFVAYWRWAQEWNRIVKANPEHATAPRANEGMHLTYAILNVAGIVLGIFALLPMLIIYLVAMKNLCAAVNYAARR